MTKDSLKILLVEDNRGDVVLIEDGLEGNKIKHATSLQEAFASLSHDDFDVILLDLNLPDSYELSTFKKIAVQVKNKTPIVVLTGLNDDEIGMQAVQLGAEDYLVKGHFDRRPLLRSIYYSIERNKLKKELSELALFDELTGLYNRRGFKNILEQKIRESRRKKQVLALFLIDLNRMKKINDEFGHRAGDLALIDTAKILMKTFRQCDVISRWGGDEFVVLGVDAEGSVTRIRQRLQANLDEHNQRGQREFTLSMSIGEVVQHCDAQTSAEELINEADRKMYQQKGDR